MLNPKDDPTPMNEEMYDRRDEILATCEKCKELKSKGVTNITILAEHERHKDDVH